MFGHGSSSLMFPQHVHTETKPVFIGGQWLRLHLNMWPCSVVHAVASFQVIWGDVHILNVIWLLYYCFIHRAWTNYFNSSLHCGVDWQLPSLEWSVCFLDSAEAIWCILTIIGATATVMFSKPLCYFPGQCPWGICEELLGLQRRLQSQDRWEHCCPLQIRDTTT